MTQHITQYVANLLDSYTAGKRRAFRKARRQAMLQGLFLKRFKPGPDEPDPPEVFFAKDVRDKGWVVVSYSYDTCQWSIIVHKG